MQIHAKVSNKISNARKTIQLYDSKIKLLTECKNKKHNRNSELSNMIPECLKSNKTCTLTNNNNMLNIHNFAARGVMARYILAPTNPETPPNAPKRLQTSPKWAQRQPRQGESVQIHARSMPNPCKSTQIHANPCESVKY